MINVNVLICFIGTLAALSNATVLDFEACASGDHEQEHCPTAGNKALIQQKKMLNTVEATGNLSQEHPVEMLEPSVWSHAGPFWGILAAAFVGDTGSPWSSDPLNKAIGGDSGSDGKFHLQFDGGRVECDVFYTTDVDASSDQSDLRQNNVQKMIEQFPEIRRMDVMTWQDDWPLVKAFFAALGTKVDIEKMSTADAGPSKASQGKISHWATLMMAIAYQIRFIRPCMVLLEDDVQLPKGFTEAFSELHVVAWKPSVIQFSKDGQDTWGAGWVFNLPSAKRFLHLTCETGIVGANDNFILQNFDVTKENLDFELLVEPNNGSISGSPQATQDEFNYDSQPSEHCYNELVGGFADDAPTKDILNLTSVSIRLTDGKSLLQRSVVIAESWYPGKPSHINTAAHFIVLGLVPFMVLMVLYMYGEKGASVTGCILAYLGFLTTIQFTVKLITVSCGFNYPAFITTLHFVASSLCGICMMAFRSRSTGVPLVVPTMHEFSCLITPMAVAFAAATLLTNSALLYSSIAYVQIIGSTTPVVSAGVILLMGLPFDRWLFLATSVVVVGTVVSIKGEVRISWLGTACAFSANVLRAVKATMTQYIMQSEETKKKFDACTLLTWMCFSSIFLMAAVSAVGEGWAPLKDLASSDKPMILWAAISVSCLNAAGLNLFALIVTKELGAVGQQISGQLKNVLCFFGGIVVFHEVVQMLEIAGFAVVLAGVNLYQIFDRRLKERMKQEQAAKS